jgi:hypothetical protein
MVTLEEKAKDKRPAHREEMLRNFFHIISIRTLMNRMKGIRARNFFSIWDAAGSV